MQSLTARPGRPRKAPTGILRLSLPQADALLISEHPLGLKILKTAALVIARALKTSLKNTK